VGDLMKSITLLQWSAGELTELARDVNANWMTAVAFLDDDTFLGAENALNLFAARKRADAPTEEVFPMGQSVHVCAPPSANLPAAQASQVSETV